MRNEGLIRNGFQLLQKRAVSPVDLIKESISVISSVESQRCKAFSHVIDHGLLLQEATESAERWKSNTEKSPIDGLPVCLKENFAIKSSEIPTEAGSKMLGNYYSPFNSTVAERLKTAGAIIVGCTGMDEFAMGSFGMNSKNPVTQFDIDPLKVPGGSSSGCAVAVQSGAVFAAIGTDTGGSVRLPAAFCGCSAVKPSYGRISRHGIVEYAGSLDTVGVLSRSVLDAELVANILGQHPDENDSTTSLFEEETREDSSLRVGFCEDFLFDELDDHPGVLDSVDLCLQQLSNFTDQEIKPIKLFSNNVDETHSADPILSALAAYYCIATAEASSNLSRYDGLQFGFRTEKASPDMKHFEEICLTRTEGFGLEVQKRLLMGNFVLSKSIEHNKMCYEKAVQIRQDLINAFHEEVFSKVDILISPVSPIPAPELNYLKEAKQQQNDADFDGAYKEYLSDIFNVCFSLAGLPSAVVPVPPDLLNLKSSEFGTNSVQVVANFGQDRAAFKVASHLQEQLGKARL